MANGAESGPGNQDLGPICFTNCYESPPTGAHKIGSPVSIANFRLPPCASRKFFYPLGNRGQGLTELCTKLAPQALDPLDM